MHTGDDRAYDLMDRGLRAVDAIGVPESPKLLNFRGKCLLLLGRGDEGCAAFHRCTAIYPETSFAWNNAAICDLRNPDLRDDQGPKFEKALALAYRAEHRDAARANLDAYHRWRAAGYAGRFDGTLVY